MHVGMLSRSTDTEHTEVPPAGEHTPSGAPQHWLLPMPLPPEQLGG